MEFEWGESSRAFAEAAEWFVATTALVGSRWSEPGLGEWDVRSLVGHTSRALITVEEYLARPATAVETASAAEYFRTMRALGGGSAIAERGRAAGRALGDDPAAAVADLAARVVPLVESRNGAELIVTAAGGMRLADYLPTRTFELVVHTTDLCAALGLAPGMPATAATQALRLVTDIAVADELAGLLLMATTGRSPLPPGFSVL